jgi:hypothetical protein
MADSQPSCIRAWRADHDYDRRMPRLWAISLAILVACLLASMVIAIGKLA